MKKDKLYAQMSINHEVDKFILALADNYNPDWAQLSYSQYINLARDRVLKKLKQFEIESSDNWND